MTELSDIPIPHVERVHGPGGGSHIEPPLDQTWTDAAKLAWHAAIVNADTGLTIRISTGGYRFNISTPGAGTGPLDFHSAWTYLNGIDHGVRAARAGRTR